MFAVMHNPRAAYNKVGIETGIDTADPHKLVLMLFEGAMLAVASASLHMRRKDGAEDIARKGEAISKAINIITNGLKASLDQEAGGELAGKLGALYDYMSSRLLYANAQRPVGRTRRGESSPRRIEERLGTDWEQAMSSLALYESMSALSAQMAEAAAACDWDRLAALEKDCAGLARHLETNDTPVRLSDADRARKMDLIRRILADDAEVRRHAEPWMAQVRQFLGGGARARSVRRAYGAHSGQ